MGTGGQAAMTAHPAGRAGAPILVTGSHRSGSTWAGKMLAAAPGVVYVHEPFSMTPQDRVLAPRFTRWFTYVTAENEEPYRERFQRMADLRYPWLDAVQARPTPRGLASATRRAGVYLAARLRGGCALIKAPGALMSSEWLADRFGTRIVILIRHPCGFVASIKRMNWRFRFENLYGQPLLMRDLLAAYDDEMRRLDATDHDLIDNGAAVWKIFHHVIRVFQERHPDWHFIRYEDLASNPMAGYEALYGRLGLKMSPAARATIEQHCYARTPLEDRGELHRLTRNSQDDAWSWRRKLSPAEIERIRAWTEPVSRHFYTEQTWEASAPAATG
jgi:LPS sulfotransferase NodH